MRSFLFRHYIAFYTVVLISLTILGFVITQQPIINTEEHILIQVEKRVEPSYADKPYTLVLRWRFPEGSSLYDPNEISRYNLEHSTWSGTNWVLEKNQYGIASNQEKGVFATRYSTAESLNDAYNAILETDYWKEAIKNAKK